MSLIYSITSTITRDIEDILRKSLLFTLIFNILEFIEKEWVNSYFKSLYPNEKFLSFFNKSKVLEGEIFSPLIVLVTLTLFLLLATDPVSRDLQMVFIIAFISFFIGSVILPRFILNNQKSESDNENITDNDKDKEDNEDNNKNNQIPIFDSKDIYSIGFCLTLIGILFLFISIASVGGLPILKSSLRYSLKPIFTMPVFLVIPGIGLIASHYLNMYKNNEITRSQARFRFLLLTAIGIVTVLTLQYRTPIIAILLMMIIIGYYGKMIASSMPGSDLGPRMLVGKLIAWRTEVTVTPTLLGQMLVDFGKVGVAVEMCLLGFILGTGYKIIKITQNSFYIAIYSLILTYSIVGVETGILDIQVLFYFFVISFIYLAVILKDKGMKIY